MAYEHKHAKGRGNAYDDFANLTTKGLIGGDDSPHPHSKIQAGKNWWERHFKREKDKPKRIEKEGEATLTINI